MARNNQNNVKKSSGKRNTKQRPNSRSKSRNSRDCEATEDKVNSVNDSSWYTQYPELIRDSASINFNEIMGKEIELPKYTESTGEVIDMSFTSPGVLALDVIPMYGMSEDNTSSLNQAASALYAWVRHANSGSKNYEAADLMLYCMAMSEVYAYINFLQRVYGMALSYNTINRYFPDSLLFANYVNYDGFNTESKLAEFRYGINRLINKASVFAVPADMPIFQRHAFLYQNIYTEGVSAREQLYMFVPAGFHKYVETEGPGHLKYIPFNDKRRTLPELIEYGNALLDALMLSEDINTMSGDIIKAYGSNLIKLSPLGLEYPVPVLFDVPVLEQIRNATVVGEASSFDIEQNALTGALYSVPRTNDARWRAFMSGRHIINTVNPEPTNVYVTEITRLKTACDSNDKLLFGSEIVSRARIITRDGSDTISRPFSTFTTPRVVVNGTNPSYDIFFPNLASELQIQSLRCNFDYAPAQFMYLYCKISNVNELNDFESFENVGWIVDLDNYATIDGRELGNIHDACMASMFVSPLVKKYSK